MTNARKSNKIIGVFTFSHRPLATLFYMASRCWGLEHLLRQVGSLWLKPGPMSVRVYVPPAGLLGPSDLCSWFISAARVCGGSWILLSRGSAGPALIAQPSNCWLQCQKCQRLLFCVEKSSESPTAREKHTFSCHKT